MGKFQFKQFCIHQEKSAFKVGTDGVLLGAWVDVDGTNNILDIGTGTGLIALMLAQRNQKAKIAGIEMDHVSFLEAKENMLDSPWSDRLSCVEGKLQKYSPRNKFDHIVSNPPYFVNDLKNKIERKTNARHLNTLTLEEIVSFVKIALKREGKFSYILPVETDFYLLSLLQEEGFEATRSCWVYPKKGIAAKRVMRTVMMKELLKENNEEHLIIEKEKRHDFTEEYMALTKDFYLKF